LWAIHEQGTGPLQAIADLDLTELQATIPPRGFGSD
jgi:hypothetical protein